MLADTTSTQLCRVYPRKKSESKEVNVLIDSLGGSVASAFSICEAFRRHGNVKVHYVGMNASAATIASLGAKHISIATSGMYLVHKCSTVITKWASLNADQLRQLIEEYDKQKKGHGEDRPQYRRHVCRQV